MASAPEGRVMTFDLSVARTRERIPIDGAYVRIIRCNSPIAIQFSDPGDSLPIEQDSRAEICTPGDSIKDIFLTNDAGSGRLELFVSSSIRIPDFSTAGNLEAANQRILGWWMARSFAGSFTISAYPNFDTVDNNRLIGATSGDGALAQNSVDPNAGVSGLTIQCDVGASANSNARVFGQDRLNPNILNVINSPAQTIGGRKDWELRLRDEVFLQMTISGGNTGVAQFGFGSHFNLAAGGLDGGFLGFAAGEGSPNWHAVAYAGGSADFGAFDVEVDLAVPFERVNFLETRIGVSGGTPFCHLYANGSKVYEFTLPLPSDIDENWIQPGWSSHRSSGADSIQLMAWLGCFPQLIGYF